MPTLTTFLAFMVASAILVMIPGPAVIYIVNRGISQGRRAAVVSALGIEAGALVHVVAATVGLSAVIASSATLFSVVKYVGAAYLILLGIMSWRSRSGHDAEVTTLKAVSYRRLFGQGIVVNIFNPKVGVFFLAFLPQFVSPGHGAVWFQMLLLGVVFLLVATALDLCYAFASGSVGQWLGRRPRIAVMRNRISGATYIALGSLVGVSKLHGQQSVGASLW
jgi:threonine/homoserine/homoserine lactone efflux protein